MWDYIVVGAGSAGCALAYQLAQDRSRRVLVVEAGKSDRSPFIKVPAGQVGANKRFDWGYVSEPDPSRLGRTDPWLRGKVLGGSSSVNGTMYVRGAPTDFDRWRAVGNPGWGYADVVEHFEAMEGLSGSGIAKAAALRLRKVRAPHPVTQQFVAAAQATGLPLNEDYNGASQAGVFYPQLTQSGGLRWSAADAFLKPALKQANVRLLLGAHVERVVIEDGRATGIWVSTREGRRFEPAAQVILCCGALNTPQVLMLSGVGDPAELEALGVPVTIARQGVGRNLQEHPLLKMIYRTRRPTYNLTGGLAQKLSIAAKYLLQSEGPLANIFEAGAFLRSDAAVANPDLQLHFLPVGYSLDAQGTVSLCPFPSVTVLVNLSYPKSRGRVVLASPDPAAAPKIQCRLLEDPQDVSALVEGVAAVRRIMAAAPLSESIAEEVSPGAERLSRDAIQAWVQSRTEIAFHPAGTCRMGNDEDAVVDHTLRVRGAANLYVADASVLPDLPSGNTNAVCMMVGWKLGHELRSRSKP